MNLRVDMPVYDTPELAAQWAPAAAVMEEMGEIGVPCAMTLATRRIMFQTCRAIGARTALDIGTFTGSSALALALAVDRVVSVDIEDSNADDAHWSRFERPYRPRELLLNADVSHKVEFVTMDSVAFLKNSTRTFDFISLDGWHESAAVFGEIPLAIDRLNPGGLIFLDDVQPNGPPPGNDTIEGPLAAIEQHLLEGLPIKVHFIPQTIEGTMMAGAFLTQVTRD